MTDNTTIGILLFDGAEELDFVGPFEVFTMAGKMLERAGKEQKLSVVLISADGKDITGAKGMRIGADASFETAPRLDVLCVPGGEGTRQEINNEALTGWIKQQASHCTWTTSVCTGAFLLAKAGLTKGRDITTHWATFDEFNSLKLEGNLQSGVRYVQDKDIVTAAGVSAGIDMALWLVGQLYDVPLARMTQKAMEYDPLPPYQEEDV
jgi:transcriptional regulator GlxA family with amidase domain